MLLHVVTTRGMSASRPRMKMAPSSCSRPARPWCSRTLRCVTNSRSFSAPRRGHGCGPPTGCSGCAWADYGAAGL